MAALLKAGDLPLDEFLTLVAMLDPGPDSLLSWVEGLDGWTLDRWDGLESRVSWNASGRLTETRTGREALVQSVAGRLFAPSGELKWRRLSNREGYRVVFLGNRDWLPGRLTPRDELLGLHRSERPEEILLWGQRTPASYPDWVELRIPHRLRYPVEQTIKDRPLGVKVRTEVWSDRWGEVHFVRLCELVTYHVEES